MLKKPRKRNRNIKLLLRLHLMLQKPPNTPYILKKRDYLLKNLSLLKQQLLKLKPLPYFLNRKRREKEFYSYKKKDLKNKELKVRELKEKKISGKKNKVKEHKLRQIKNAIRQDSQKEKHLMKNWHNRLSNKKQSFKKQWLMHLRNKRMLMRPRCCQSRRKEISSRG